MGSIPGELQLRSPVFNVIAVISNDLAEGPRMKRIAISMAVLMLLGGIANAQSGAPSGRGATKGDPAASSADPNAAPSSKTTGSAMKPSRSGSGTSTSGGSDANGDQGRDQMPDSNMKVRPLDRQNKPQQ